MKLIYKNEIYEDTVSIDPSSSTTGFGASNLLDRSVDIRLVFLGKDDETVTIDAGAGNTLEADSLGLFGYNFTSSIIITIMADSAADWVTPEFSETVTYDPEGIAHLFTQQDKRYWRLRLQDTSNTDPLQLGILFLGSQVDVAYLNPAFQIDRPVSTRNSFTRSNQVRGTKKFSYYDLSFKLSYLTEAKRQDLMTVWNEHHNVEPLILLLWENSLDVQAPIYGVINQRSSFNFKKLKEEGLGFSTSFSFREVF